MPVTTFVQTLKLIIIVRDAIYMLGIKPLRRVRVVNATDLSLQTHNDTV